MQPNEKDICYDAFHCAYALVNPRVKQVETLFDVLEDIEPKLKALGIIEVNGTIRYVANDERQLSK